MSFTCLSVVLHSFLGMSIFFPPMRSSSLLLLLLLSCSAYSMLLGWVESPGYPRGYPRHASLNWSRCAPKGHTLSIKLIHLDLEDSQNCENDVVKVRLQKNMYFKNFKFKKCWEIHHKHDFVPRV